MPIQSPKVALTAYVGSTVGLLGLLVAIIFAYLSRRGAGLDCSWLGCSKFPLTRQLSLAPPRFNELCNVVNAGLVLPKSGR